MEFSYALGKFLQFIQIPQIHNSTIDSTSKIRFKCLVVNSTIGKHSYISENSSLIYTDVGSFCSIASDCFIGGAAHPINWVSSSPVFHEEKSVLRKKFSKHPFETYKKTKIGSDVWIGTHSLIKAGVTIGDGAIVAMGSVVVKDIGAYEIWGGNPAKLISRRFDDDTISVLSEIKWFDWNDEKINIHAGNIPHVKKFIQESDDLT